MHHDDGAASARCFDVEAAEYYELPVRSAVDASSPSQARDAGGAGQLGAQEARLLGRRPCGRTPW